MGQNLSSINHDISLLKCLLKQSGASVSSDQIKGLGDWILKFCPWFPEEGISDVEVWDCIGRILQKEHRQGTHIPVQIFSTWSLVKTVLEPFRENESKKQTVAQCECPMPNTPPPILCRNGKKLTPLKWNLMYI
jgi:hypothetical protein